MYLLGTSLSTLSVGLPILPFRVHDILNFHRIIFTRLNIIKDASDDIVITEVLSILYNICIY